MTAQEAISYIESCGWSNTRLGLDRTRELLHRLGDPHLQLKFVHVAGTNGKGSTCAMLSSILRQAGYKTGLYTSPYICCFHERMQVNGQNISDEQLSRLTARVMPIADAMDDHPSQFELVTAIAMLYYLEEHCDVVVLEVGLGGQLDSTNVIESPECAVICNIGLEHTEYLGDTLEKIALAKAGIIKEQCPAVFYRSTSEAETVFRETAEQKRAAFRMADFAAIKPLEHSLRGQTFSWKEYENLYLPLLGNHQLRNAAVVLEVVDVLRQNNWDISACAVRRGLAETVWPARFEVLRKTPPIIVDGAHNPQCAQALADSLAIYLPEKESTFLIGVLSDKDYEAILHALRPYAKRFVCVTPNSPRSLSGAALAAYLRAMGENAESKESIADGVTAALLWEEPLVVCGSLYLAGLAREELKRQLYKEKADGNK